MCSDCGEQDPAPLFERQSVETKQDHTGNGPSPAHDQLTEVLIGRHKQATLVESEADDYIVRCGECEASHRNDIFTGVTKGGDEPLLNVLIGHPPHDGDERNSRSSLRSMSAA